MAGPTAASANSVDSSEFTIDLQLQSKQLVNYLTFLTLFYSAFAITFFIGIPLVTEFEYIGTSSKTEALMDKYNTYLGYVMALVEVLVSMYMDTFVPVLEVYLHNRLFFLQCDAEGKPRAPRYRHLRTALLCMLPVILSLTNSGIKSLQAAQISTGIRRVVTIHDLKEEPIEAKPLQQVTSHSSASDTILKNALRPKATPFTFDTKSPCSQKLANESATSPSDLKLNAHDLGSTSAVYGFIPRDWNTEAMIEPIRTSTYTVTYQQALSARSTNSSVPVPGNFSVKVAYEMLVQGKMVIERAIGNAKVGEYDCSLSDGLASKAPSLSLSLGNATGDAEVVDDVEVFLDESMNQWTIGSDGTRLCEGGVSSMLKMSNYYNRDKFTVEDLILDATEIIAITIPEISREKTNITLETYNLTSQIRLETMQIDLILNTSVRYGLEDPCPDDEPDCEVQYAYGPFRDSFCGSNNCAFVDVSESFPVQPEIGVLPYYANCTLGPDRVHYSADFRAFYPDECTRSRTSTFLYGYGSYITGKEFGASEPVWKSSYIAVPRRRITFTFARVVWTTEDLATSYGAKCDNSTNDPNVTCSGLSYQLQPSGRFLFAGKAALPTGALRTTSFRSPIPLVQLNLPPLKILGGQVAIERLAPENFDSLAWPRKGINDSTLRGKNCSMLIDSYLKHVEENNFFLERPLQVMYTSFFYFLMENAAVTEKSLALNSSKAGKADKALMNDKLGNVRLKGDKQVRSIHVSIPLDSFYTTAAGCAAIFVATVVIVLVPARRVKYFAEGTTKAEQFVAMSKDAEYPDDVHNKLVEFPETHDSVRFDALEIEALELIPFADLVKPVPRKDIQAQSDSDSDSDSDSEATQAATCEEIP